MKITVVRHGETEGNLARVVQSRTDGVLSATGVAQARIVAERLKGQEFDYVACSPLGRCQQTARIIVEPHQDVVISIEDMLIERGLGTYEGRSWDDVPWESIEGDNLDKKLPGGESWQEVESRVSQFLSNLYERFPEGNVLIVTHGGTIKAFTALLDGISLKEAVGNQVSHNGATHTWDIKSAIPAPVR